jgi:hypothetical protein
MFSNATIRMFSTKDYSKMTLEELVSEEKKVKAQKTTIAVFIGVMVGAAVWAATHKGGFFFPVILLFFALRIGYRSTQNLKNIQMEISRKDTAG